MEQTLQNIEAPSRIESRWAAGAAVSAVVILEAILPARVRLGPTWVPYVLGVAMIAPMAGAMLSAGKGWWEKVERITTVLFSVVIVGGALGLLFSLVRAMVDRTNEVTGLALLTSSTGVWFTNVLAFSLLYWQIDRGGPGSREHRENIAPDWHFPQATCPEKVGPYWQPTFVDYLFLGYSTATAFSATDTVPLSGRAKLLMMLESTISLITIVVVASRAMNILGGQPG